MWILTPSITSAFAAATGASTSVSSEQLASAFARSLLSRSKPSPQRTWLQRLKRDSWTTHLSGAISSDSLGESFTDWWTSSLAATRASHSAQPASDSAPKTHDTSGRLSQPELLQCDQVPAFLKTSRDISALGYPTLSKTWADWVTERRGAWRQRVNAARLTRGKGSSSWPTVTANEDSYRIGGESQQSKCLSAMARRGEMDNGQAAPASSSSLGSRQGLWVENWITPQSGDVTGSTQAAVDMWAQGQRPKTSDQRLRTQVAAMEKRQELWPTITAHTPDMESNGPNGHSGTYLAGAVKSWMTPRACEAQNPPMGVDKRHHGLTHQVTKQWGSPAANDANKTPHCEVNSNQAGLAKSVGLELQRQWATPQQRDFRSAEGNEDRWENPDRSRNLNDQIKQQATEDWPTVSSAGVTGGPTGLAGGSGNRAKMKRLMGGEMNSKLNPRWVETLMGLPIGWTMPSCTSPVTIAPTSCDSSGMALCRPAQSGPSDFLLAS